MKFLDWLLASEAWYRQWRGGTWTFYPAQRLDFEDEIGTDWTVPGRWVRG